MNISNPIANKVLDRLQSANGQIFSVADFLDLGPRPTVDQALSRLARQGKIQYPRFLVCMGGFWGFFCGQFVGRIYTTWLISDGEECQRLQNVKEFLVAATFEKSKTYVFDGLGIMNPAT